MCKHCIEPGGSKMRDTPLDENELAKLARLKKTDPAKYPAMMPAWIKTHNRLVAVPKPFEFKPHQPPAYPSWIANCGKPLTADQEANLRRYPQWREGMSVAEYVRTFESMNVLTRGA